MSRFSKHSRIRGAALIIVLAFVVLLTALVVAYFSRSMWERQISNGSFNQTKADEIARNALETLTSNLRQEIMDPNVSTAVQTGSTTLYFPTAIVRSGTTMYPGLVPVRNGVPANWSAAGSVQGAQNATLIRESGTAPIASPGVDQVASGVFTSGTDTASTAASASVNGRAITMAQWNKHYLVPLKDATNPSDTTPDASFVPPCWVYVTGTGGPAVPALNSPGGDVIGRYAYVMYDEGALLDANVAGYPDLNTGTSTPLPYSPKGAVAYADLTQLTLTGTSAGNAGQLINQAGVNNLVGWRNYASLQNGVSGSFPALTFSGTSFFGTYVGLINSNTAGFLTVSQTAGTSHQTDQSFLNRQELINLVLATGTANFNPAALQYLGTFSRASTVPWWSTSTVTGTNPDLMTLHYSSDATIPHYTDDGTRADYQVKAGDLFFQKRFSLGKLAWLTYKGPAASAGAGDSVYNKGGTDAAIQACFGLKWNAAQLRWDYVGPTGSTAQSGIETLAQVLAESPAREPNFFEVLKAVIANGSLGKNPGAVAKGAFIEAPRSVEGPLGYDFDSYSAVPDFQIIQIGANIIDQSDIDNYPTAIYLNFTPPRNYPEGDLYKTAFGIENLPYISRMGVVTAVTQDAASPGQMQTEGTWLQPELWNPHQSPTGYPGNLTPASLRMVTLGESYAINMVDTQVGQPVNPGAAITFGNDPANGTSGGIINITNSSVFFNNPVPVTDACANSPGTRNTWSSAGNVINFNSNKFVAVWTGDVQRIKPATAATAANRVQIYPDPYLTFVLQYSDGSNWRPYATMSRINIMGTQSWASGNSNGNPTWKEVAAHPDPRTDRFSAMESEAQGPPSGSVWPYADTIHWSNGAATMGAVFFGYPRPTSGFTYTPVPDPAKTSNNLVVDKWSQNIAGSAAYYSDPDSVVRPGDAFRADFTIAAGDGIMLYHQNMPAGVNAGTAQGRRPAILNRPFRSVGELGYVFRDLPFKTLDFWSSKSADSGLLELFSVSDEPNVVAGLVNINNASPVVLQSIIAGTLKNEVSGLTMGTADAQALAAQVVSQVSASPIRNRADMVAVLSSAIDAKLTSIPNLANKAYGEAPLRALCGSTNERTWNLMIDVIAQAGMFPAGAKSLNNFVVQGERRYWLHIAIDRLTGKIIERQFEPVYE